MAELHCSLGVDPAHRTCTLVQCACRCALPTLPRYYQRKERRHGLCIVLAALSS